MKTIARRAALVLSIVAVGSQLIAAGLPAPTPDGPAWSVQEWQGMPALWKENQPVTPMLFWQWKPEAYEIQHFSKTGINLFSFFGSFQHYAHPFWRQDGSVELTFQDAEIGKLLFFNPKCFFLPRLFATAPAWWVEANPGEVCLFGSGRQLKEPRESFASEKWLREGGDAYRRAVRHLLDADYGKNLLGIHVTNGPWGENFFWDAYWGSKPTPEASDVSEPMRRRLIRYLREKYGD
ncbi:MAG: hypothetical protein GXY83_44105, partial [Rhodopirellula sp.]|nr:hypothetical protein [Rhodopirellula sp.]